MPQTATPERPAPMVKTFTVQYRGHRDLSREDLERLLSTIAQQGETITVTETSPAPTEEELQTAAARLETHAAAIGLPEDALDEDTHASSDDAAAAQANNDGVSGQIEFLLRHGWKEAELIERMNALLAEGEG